MKGAMYRLVVSGYHNSGLRALTIISQLPYIVTLKHDLLHTHYNQTIMKICIFMV